MKKTIIKLITSLLLSFWIIWISYWAALNLPNESSNLKNTNISDDVWENIENLWVNALSKVKLVVSWVILIFLVYAWAQMILSMWNNEEQLSSSKRTLWYSLIWFVFINIPWSLYNSFKWNKTNTDWWISSSWSNDPSNASSNLFINTDILTYNLNNYIISFLEIATISMSIIIFVISWIKIMTSRWREEQVNEWKNKIVWWVIWLIFIGFIEAWKNFIYNWEINDGRDIFETIANLWLFFAGPIAIFFLSLAWYYLITSDWNEDKLKKAKDIVINTLIWTVILLCSYIFLNDIITL